MRVCERSAQLVLLQGELQEMGSSDIYEQADVCCDQKKVFSINQ